MFKDFFIHVRLNHPLAKLPDRAYSGDAGFDLYSCEYILIEEGKRHLIPIGIQTEFPEGYVCLIRDRSSTPETHICVAGVIDSGYRGDWFVQVIGRKKCLIKPGDKIAQFLILPVFTGNLVQVENLSSSERGAKNLGSSN
jgi:dUTP pyrophosphatase